MASYDVLGNIMIVKFSREAKLREKKEFALDVLGQRKDIRTILEKSDKFRGRLRTLKTRWIAGEKTKESLYKENGCVFRLNVDSCYFSPRLSTERKEIASKVKRGEKVLVMFGGVAPFAVVVGKHSRAGKVVSVELGKECSKYALENVRRNKLIGKVEIVQGDVKKVIGKGKKVIGKGKKVHELFDRIVMARPNLKDSFLDVAFPVVKKNGMIYYYGFTENRKFSVPKTLKSGKKVSGYAKEDLHKMKEMILEEAKKAKRKIKIMKIKKAGDIGVKKWRYRADIKLLS